MEAEKQRLPAPLLLEALRDRTYAAPAATPMRTIFDEAGLRPICTAIASAVANRALPRPGETGAIFAPVTILKRPIFWSEFLARVPEPMRPPALPLAAPVLTLPPRMPMGQGGEARATDGGQRKIFALFQSTVEIKRLSKFQITLHTVCHLYRVAS